MRGVGGEKISMSGGIMFPRLHVNDADKGGPRAPPRNKMALYEQFSVPSQTSLTKSPPKQHNNNTNTTFLSSISSPQASGFPSSFTPFRDSTAPSNLATSSGGGGMIKLNYQRSDSDASGGIKSTAKSVSSSQTCNYSQVKSFSFKMPGNDNNAVRSSMSGSQSNKIPRSSSTQQSKDSKRLHHKSSCENIKSSGHSVREHSDQNTRPSSSSVRIRKEHVEVLNQESHNSSRNVSSSKFLAMCEKVIVRDNNVVEPKARVGISESFSRQLLTTKDDDGGMESEKNCKTPTTGRHVDGDDVREVSMVDATLSILNVRPDDVVHVIGEKQFWKARRTITYQQRIFALQVFELHRLIKVQRSIAGSPDVLLNHSAYLHKSRAKQASPQVKKTQSEHINVKKPPAAVVKHKNCHDQKLLGQEDDTVVRKLRLPYKGGVFTKQSSYDEYLRNPTPAAAAPRPPPAAMNNSAAWPFHSASGNQWLVPVMTPSEGLVYKPYSTPGFAVPNYGSCGPMSLNAGSTYGGPGPGSGSACNNNTNDHNHSHDHNQQAVGTPAMMGNQTYYHPPPFGLPVMNPFVPSSGVEQMVPFGIGRTNEAEYNNQCSFEEVNFTKPPSHLQSSCNISSQMSRAMSYPAGEAFQGSKGMSELQQQTSTASSSSERSRGDATPLPLFPMGPTPALDERVDQNTDDEEEEEESSKHRSQTRVIKVVPHNATLATESAARIFRSIQEERKHLQLISS
ncbi:hypothetical protein F8388_000519 [Cannabis sativa]|uniref:Early flowering 3 n=1 Tax=Cannabis sativa TaxID=3483 RepID=A0A7J6EZI3_CANSA|nr:hypothetical protein F8388_000519 [Cannabis sativa]